MLFLKMYKITIDNKIMTMLRFSMIIIQSLIYLMQNNEEGEEISLLI